MLSEGISLTDASHASEAFGPEKCAFWMVTILGREIDVVGFETTVWAGVVSTFPLGGCSPKKNKKKFGDFIIFKKAFNF